MNEILSSITLSNEAHIFSEKARFKEAIRGLNKSSCPSSDKITPQLIQNRGKTLITCIAILLQGCHLLEYFPKCWNQSNRIYMKNPVKDNYHIHNFSKPIFRSNIMGKIYEKS